MKNGLILLAIMFCTNVSFGQFNFESQTISKKKYRKLVKDAPKASLIIYDDADYLFSKRCAGEFGGELIVKDKKTEKEYCCEATCALQMIRFENGYYLLSSLTHMRGSFELIKIVDPKEMKVYQRPKPKISFKRRFWRTTGRYQGTNIIASKRGESAIGAFGTTKDIYVLATKNNYLKLYKVVNDTLELKDSILTQRWYHDYNLGRKQIDNSYYFFVKTYENAKGIVIVEDGKIKILSREK